MGGRIGRITFVVAFLGMTMSLADAGAANLAYDSASAPGGKARAEAIAASTAELSEHPAPAAESPQIAPSTNRDGDPRAALLRALTDPRPQARSEAARTLALASDEGALSAIEQGIDSGLFSEFDAANYFGLADIRVGGPYLLRRLARGSSTAKATAVRYLGVSRSYQLIIREKVFLNPEADSEARAAAATVLSEHDPTFASYALVAVLDPKVPPLVFANTVKGYVFQTMKAGNLDAPNRFLIQRAIRNYEERLGDAAPLKELNDALDIMGF
jgi:hypothetical protein